MPKLHDAAQIFAEEIIARLHEFSQAEAPFVLALAYHAVEDDLALRHPQALVIAGHLWQVLAETIQRQSPGLEQPPPAGLPPISEDDIRLGYLLHSAIQTGRSLFPSRGY